MSTAEDARARFAQTIAHHSKSFAMAAKLLPADARLDAQVLYAWCRRADDAVDEDPEGAETRLMTLRTELDQVYSGAPSGDIVLDAFAEVVARTGIPRAYPEALLDGMEMDVVGSRYETLEDVVHYSYRVASTVGLMMCHALGIRDERALRRAAHLGIGMQLSNIARDIAEDWDRGRRYLPMELLREEGVEALEPDGAPLPEAQRGAIAGATLRLLDLADGYYRSGDRGIRDLSLRAGFAIRAARLIYSRIGHVIRRRGGDPLLGRAFVTTAGKLALVGRALLSTLWMALRFDRRPLRAPETTLPPVLSVLALDTPTPTPAPRRGWIVGTLLVTLATLVPLLIPAPPVAGQATATGTVIVELHGFNRARGSARAALFLDSDGFPTDRGAAWDHGRATIEGDHATITFEDVPTGSFAVAAFHDRDDDGELDLLPIGAPSEPYGASRDARRAFGPPRWRDARLQLDPGETEVVSIHVH